MQTSDMFIQKIESLKKNEFLKVPCKSGGTIQLEKAQFPYINLYYFAKGAIQPEKVSTTDINTLKYMATLAAATTV